MKALIVLAAAAAALSTSACVTVIDANDDPINWTGQNAQPFDGARDACIRSHGTDQHSSAFRACMADKGWRPG